jgi:hypothetical protein
MSDELRTLVADLAEEHEQTLRLLVLTAKSMELTELIGARLAGLQEDLADLREQVEEEGD